MNRSSEKVIEGRVLEYYRGEISGINQEGHLILYPS